MRKVILTGFIVALSLLIIPLRSIKSEKKAVETSAKTEYKETVPTNNETQETTFKIKIGEEIKELSAQEYLCGVLAAEMPTDFEIEALKAQSVAAFSFALYRKSEKRYDGFDLTDSFKTDQSYISEEAWREKWGENYEEKAKKISEAVNSTLGEYLSFDGKVALTLYHSLSSGITNSCKDVFGSDVPYLISVDSEGDKLCPDYKSVFSFSAEELKSKLSEVNKDAKGENLFSDFKTAKSGLVATLSYGGKSVSGGKIASLLGLPSAAFTVEYVTDGYTFTCFGRGHGVGMSQYGAEFLAKGGADYKEILSHYYPGTKLQKL